MYAHIFKIKDPTTSFYTCIQSRIIITVKKIKIHYTYLYKFISKNEPHTEIIFSYLSAAPTKPKLVYFQSILENSFSVPTFARETGFSYDCITVIVKCYFFFYDQLRMMTFEPSRTSRIRKSLCSHCFKYKYLQKRSSASLQESKLCG